MKKVAKREQVQVTYPIEVAVAAAVAAHKDNLGAYVKPQSIIAVEQPDGTMSYQPDARTPNLLLIKQYLAEQDRISADCYDRAADIISHFKGQAVIAILAGRRLSDFELSVNDIVSKEQIVDRQVNGFIACLPSVYEKAMSRLSVDDRIRMADKVALGRDGTKVSVEGEVVRSIYSMKWNTNVLTIITSTNQVAFFFYNRTGIAVGDKVKASGTITRFTTEGQTQLSRVKLGKISDFSTSI